MILLTIGVEMRLLRQLVLAAGFLGFVTACGNVDEHSSEQISSANADGGGSKAEIADRIEGYLAAIQDGDVAAVGDYWTVDAKLSGPGMSLDREAVLDGIERAANAGLHVEVLDRKTLELFVHRDAAYEIAQADEVFTPQDGQPDTVRNNLFIRWEKGSDEKWRFDRVLLSPREAASD